MTEEGRPQWGLVENDQDDVLEVMPLFGKAHIHSTECWCHPHWDTKVKGLLIHECDN